VAFAHDGTDAEADEGWHPALLEGKTAQGGGAAYLCRGTHCLPPTSDADELEALLDRR
jgi:hypothetical protein